MAAFSNRLSRWTLPVFACALVNFLAAQGLILAGLSWPMRPVSAPGTLATVHLLTVGWLLLLMFGALFQFVPVITSRPLVSQRRVLWTLITVQLGLMGMICGFFGAAAGSPALAIALPAGGAMVILGVLLALWNIGVPLLSSRPLTLPGRMLLSGLAFLLVTVILGISFALAFTVPVLAPYVAPLLGGIGGHALAGLGGWFTLAAMGVTYKLLPMFMLAPEDRGIVGDCVHILGTSGFALAVGAGLARIWTPGELLWIAESTGFMAIVISVAVYLWDIVRIYRTRKRVIIEAHNKAAVGAFGFLGLGAASALGLLATGGLGAGSPAIVFLMVFGWLGGLGLTQLYKIIPFLTWLLRYGGSLGRGPVPRVQDLVKERRGYTWFALYFLGVLFGAASLLAGTAQGFRVSLSLIALATLGLVTEYWRAWRCHYTGVRHGQSSTRPFVANHGG